MMLSFDGRIILIKAVLGSIPSYNLSLFRAPLGVINHLEILRKRFLWGGCYEIPKIHWVSWSKVLAPKTV